MAHDPADAIPTANARHIPDAGSALDHAEYYDLWVYLGARDARITRAYPDTAVFDLSLGVCALIDPIGAAWIHRDGAITLAGTPQIADQLAALVGRWDTTGRLSVTGWTMSWHHADTGLLLPRDWHHTTTLR